MRPSLGALPRAARGACVAALVVAASACAKGPPPVQGPYVTELVLDGAKYARRHCDHCHNDVPLPQRVRGWTYEVAYEKLGVLNQLHKGMPDFTGTDEERQAVACWLVNLGREKPPAPAPIPQAAAPHP